MRYPYVVYSQVRDKAKKTLYSLVYMLVCDGADQSYFVVTSTLHTQPSVGLLCCYTYKV